MKTLLFIGLASVKANRVPMVVLWFVAVGLAVAYYMIPAVADMLQPVADFQSRRPFLAAFANQFVFCGIIPCLFRLTVSEIRTERPILKSMCQWLWSGCWGIVYVGFYALQGRMFGNGHDLATLASKMAFDQFVWSPLIPVPLTAFFCLWLESGFSFSRAAGRFRRDFIRSVWLPNLIPNWCIWIPAVLAIYAFPPPLQVQMLGLVGSLWALVSLKIGKTIAR